MWRRSPCIQSYRVSYHVRRARPARDVRGADAAGQADYACNTTPHWYHAPVIVGSSGGSGSRGVVCCSEARREDRAPTTAGARVFARCPAMVHLTAADQHPRPAPTPIKATGWLANIFSQAHSCDVNPERVRASMKKLMRKATAAPRRRRQWSGFTRRCAQSTGGRCAGASKIRTVRTTSAIIACSSRALCTSTRCATST